ALDVARAVRFYTENLGFTIVFEDAESAEVERDTVKVHFWKCDDPRIAQNTACRIEVSHAEALFEHAKLRGIVHPHGPLERKPWGSLEFTILDPEGGAVTFVEW